MIVCHSSNLRHFRLISSGMHFKTSLDMFKNRIKSHHKHYDMSGHVWESYQIASKALWPYFFNTYRSLRSIVSIKSLMSLWALKAQRVFLELKVFGAFSSGLGLNSFESCFTYINGNDVPTPLFLESSEYVDILTKNRDFTRNCWLDSWKQW